MEKLLLHTPFLLVLSGVSGAGKTTTIKQWMADAGLPDSTLISSDRCRQLLADNPDTLIANQEAFDLARNLIQERARLLKPSILDSTCLREEDLQIAFEMGHKVNLPCYHIFFDTTKALLGQFRTGKTTPPHVFKRHDFLARELRRKQQRGYLPNFIKSWRVETPEEAKLLLSQLILQPSVPRLPTQQVIIGDVHSCAEELQELITLAKQKYPQHGLVFVGDLFDRGPDPVLVAKLLLDSNAYWVPGNHDLRLIKIKEGHKPKEEWLKPEYDETYKTIKLLTEAGLLDSVLNKMPQQSQCIVGADTSTLVVVHGGLAEHDSGRFNRSIQRRNQYGLLEDTQPGQAPTRLDWQGMYVRNSGKFPVVCGHAVVPRAEWRGNTIDIDTGCVYGGQLTALVWPEKELLQVRAHKVHYSGKEHIVCNTAKEPVFNLPNPEHTLVLPVLNGEKVSIPSHKFKSALSQTRVVAPWHLWFLAPTISPAPSVNPESKLLEHTDDAIALFKQRGIQKIAAQTKHMGSRATTLICRTSDIAKENFGAPDKTVIWSRSGYPFFDKDSPILASIHNELSQALDQIYPDWEWLLIDGELMPWTLKGAGLVTGYFLPTGAAQQAYRQYISQHPPTFEFPAASQYAGALPAAQEYMKELSLYAQPPKPDEWHYGVFNVLALQQAGKRENGFIWPTQKTNQFVNHLAEQSPERFPKLDSRIFDIADAKALETYWQSTWGTSEGLVLKPDIADYSGVPAIKVRNPGYLRIIYGVDYLENIELYRQRSVNHKLGTSYKQYLISLTLLEGLVSGKKWTEMHQYALGFLALNSETLDPRL